MPRRDGEALYADMETPKEIMESFLPRKDSQIMGQTIVSIALGGDTIATPCLHKQSAVPGLSSFSHRIRGRDIVVYSDNAGAEWAVRRGIRKVCAQCLQPRLRALRIEAMLDSLTTHVWSKRFGNS